MSLRDAEIKTEYRSLIDNVAKDFYVPLLKRAVSYKRAVGWFSSSALVEISKGLAGLVENGGTIQLVASPRLSHEDVEAIKRGYELRHQVIEKALLRELNEPTSEFDKKRLNLLANLIADGVLDIKIALTEAERNGEYGMYHEKMGIIRDADGNKVAFSGSMNESATAMTVNYEAIDVFCSWGDDADRVAAKENAFTAIWNNAEPNIETIDFPNVKEEIIERFKRAKPDYDIDDKELTDSDGDLIGKPKLNIVAIPSHISLHDYQNDAIDEWAKKDFRGIFDMATGTGKTFTGLGGVVRLAQHLSGRLAVFIVCPFQHLVEQWVEDIVEFGIRPIIGYSASTQKDWKKRLENAVLDHKLKVKNREFFCFVSTNHTFSKDFVQSQISKLRGDALLVVDEAHNFGAPHLSRTLSNKFNHRLALSATLDRHNDPEGTVSLFRYFGEKCIEYSLERAIKEEKLTKYRYYPIIVTLNESELAKYSELSFEISKCIIKGRNGGMKLSERGKILAMERARLVAGAEDKLIKLRKHIQPYVNDTHILVYCGAAKMLAENQEFTTTDDEDIRQIDAVAKMLGNELDMTNSHFTSREDMKERERLKREFTSGENLQVLVAIKCLDEGVNIPKIKLAFILASTTNPKEYIQRRGRVLRLAKGKEFAIIYDFIALPRPLDHIHSLTKQQIKRDLTLVKNELCRAQEFARLAMNPAQAELVIDEIKEAYGIDDYSIWQEEDFSYE